VEDFLSQGYLPQAILNFVILLGWAPKDNRELFTLAEFVSAFDPAGFQKSNPKLNLEKLNWFNGQYLRNTTNEELVLLVKPFFPEAGDSLLRQIIPLAKERVTTLTDFSHLCKFFITPPSPQALNPEHLAVANAVLTVADWTKSGIEEPLLSNIKARNWKVGDFFMTLRLAITGSKITPPLTESMLILGKLEVLRRIHTALPMDNVK
jgi:glutamyl-tRNA synthetase